MNKGLQFSKLDTLFYKGIGIFMIVIHNYLHLQPGFGLENEDNFNPQRINLFLEHIYSLRWGRGFNTLSSIAGYFFHYGVQIFIFFSAYGLSISFLKMDNIKYINYLIKRLKKLYFLMIFGILVAVGIFWISSGQFYGIKKLSKHSFLLATSLGNFRNSTLYGSISGPFWFFGLIVQLYVIFPFVFKLAKKYNFLTILGISYLLIYPLYYIDVKTDFSVFGIIIGHLPEVLLGVYLAQNKIIIPKFFFIISLLIFLLSQKIVVLFPFSFISVIIMLLTLISWIRPYINSYFNGIFSYFGKISMILFITNGPLRSLPIFSQVSTELRAERIFLFLFILIILSHFLFLLYSNITKRF